MEDVASNDGLIADTSVSESAETLDGSVSGGSVALWVCGIIGGLAVGIAAGRLPLISKTRPERADFEVSSDLHREIKSAGSDVFDGGKSPLFPLNMNSVVQTADAITNTDVPQTWELPPLAEPIVPAGELSNEWLNALLADEFPNASQAEIDVWRDSLDGLPLSDAREIVRMRKQLSSRGLAIPGFASRTRIPSPTLKSPKTPRAVDVARSPFDQAVEALQQAARVHRHNLANTGAVGFLPGTPVLAESATGVGAVFLNETIDATAWDASETGRRADATPESGLFFSVRDGEHEFLTVMGRFVMQDDVLAIDFGDRALPVNPVVSIGADESITDAVARVQQWLVPTASELERVGGGRFQTTLRSGPAEVVDGPIVLGQLAIGRVAIEVEERALERLRVRQQLLRD